MTELKKGDRVKVSFEGDVYFAASDELGVDLGMGKTVYLEVAEDITKALTIEILEPPKIPVDAEVIRWAVERDGDYVFRYANRYGHPANGVWWLADTASRRETDELINIIGDAEVEVLKKLGG